MAEALELDITNKADKSKIIGMLNVWISTGSLIFVEDKDENRIMKKFVEVSGDV